MNRRTAIATAAAVTMTLLSGVVAVGAHNGALGIGGSPAPTVAQPVATLVADTAPAAETSPRSMSDREYEDGQEYADEYEGREAND